MLSEFVKIYQENNFTADGMLQNFVVKTGENEYIGIGLWDSKESLVAARPIMIGFLDKLRHLLEEISPELGVTEPRSGFVVWNGKQ